LEQSERTVPKQSQGIPHHRDCHAFSLGCPFAAPSLPLRFTQGFDSGLRLRASARNDRKKEARNDTPFSSLRVLRFILHPLVKDKGRSNLGGGGSDEAIPRNTPPPGLPRLLPSLPLRCPFAAPSLHSGLRLRASARNDTPLLSLRVLRWKDEAISEEGGATKQSQAISHHRDCHAFGSQ